VHSGPPSYRWIPILRCIRELNDGTSPSYNYYSSESNGYVAAAINYRQITVILFAAPGNEVNMVLGLARTRRPPAT